MRDKRNIYFAGQMTGVEGYLESASSGMVAGINAARSALGMSEIDFTRESAIGALANYISNQSVVNFQPMNVNFGIIAPLDKKVKGGKKVRNAAIGERCIAKIKEIKEEFSL
jgi:methylenetetrahydrofolate--tRNA-(uracil-5-)-methyltransferase